MHPHPQNTTPHQAPAEAKPVRLDIYQLLNPAENNGLAGQRCLSLDLTGELAAIAANNPQGIGYEFALYGHFDQFSVDLKEGSVRVMVFTPQSSECEQSSSVGESSGIVPPSSSL